MNIKPEIREKIVNAANTLVLDGVEHPTNDQVRNAMGGGSLSHISPVMREWRDSRKSQVKELLMIPDELKIEIESSLGRVWSTANQLASEAVEKVKKETDTNIGAVTEERDEALQEILKLEDEITKLKSAVTEKEQEVTNITKQKDDDRNQNSHLVSEIAALSARLSERDRQIEELKIELQETKSDTKALQDELIEIARSAKG